MSMMERSHLLGVVIVVVALAVQTVVQVGALSPKTEVKTVVVDRVVTPTATPSANLLPAAASTVRPVRTVTVAPHVTGSVK